jgi:hypothetical protein
MKITTLKKKDPGGSWTGDLCISMESKDISYAQ